MNESVEGQRENAVITHQELTDVLKAKNARKIGLDLIREHHVFSTLKEVISQINKGDMEERSVLLQRVEQQLLSAASTWNILSNQASMNSNHSIFLNALLYKTPDRSGYPQSQGTLKALGRSGSPIFSNSNNITDPDPLCIHQVS